MAEAPQVVLDLIARFERNLDEYRNPAYNETLIRVDFVNPLFKALGWDVDNEAGYATAYRDVIHEDSLRVGGSSKAPDYSFRVGGARKFFVETKKPAVSLKSNPAPAFQLRRYGYSARLALSILTDFEEFIVYDCRIKPAVRDRASVARVAYYTYRDYADQWDAISSVFHRESLLQGAFDRYADSSKGKRGTAQIDKDFVQDLDEWRMLLARNIALRNKSLDVHNLNYAVQMTIDRLVFLRMCEERGVEQYGSLRSLLNGGRTYQRLLEVFRRADERYNSGLFHFTATAADETPPDTVTPKLEIDDQPLKAIIKDLYYPDCPYEFSVLPVEVLGNAYEQFLGKTIRLTKGHQARLEEKPEVRKAGGVFYTPDYVVDYVVENSLAPLLEGKTPPTLRDLSILDPACGSGSFLLGAYQFLLDWHLRWYVADRGSSGRIPQVPPPKGRRRRKTDPQAIYEGRSGEWFLSTAAKKTILLNNIFGVDIDPMAVEVTKLSLLLKVLENENQDTINRQLRLWRERALPDLGGNIKCGNSLVGMDYVDRHLISDDEEMRRLNPFDWETEFATVQAGGFSLVLGNPPWISLTGRFGNDICTKDQLEYLLDTYSGNTYMPNMYEYFVSRGLRLTRQNGMFSFIVPDRLAYNRQFVALRKSLLESTSFVSLRFKVPFPGVTADTLIFVLRKTKPGATHAFPASEHERRPIAVRQADLLSDPSHVFRYYEDDLTQSFVGKIDGLPNVAPLSDLCKSTSGFGGKSKLITSDKTSEAQIPTLKGDSIIPYAIRKGYWFDFRKENITGRTTDVRKLGATPKILLRKTGDTIIATYDESGVFPEQSLYFLYSFADIISPLYLLALLNSPLLTAYYQASCLTNRRSIAQVKKVDLDRLPIRIPNLDDSHDKGATR